MRFGSSSEFLIAFLLDRFDEKLIDDGDDLIRPRNHLNSCRRAADGQVPDPLRRRRRHPRPDPGPGDRRARAPAPGGGRRGGSRLGLLPHVRRDLDRRAGRPQPDRARPRPPEAAGGERRPARPLLHRGRTRDLPPQPLAEAADALGLAGAQVHARASRGRDRAAAGNDRDPERAPGAGRHAPTT